LRPSVLAACAEYAALARANGMTPAQMALAWCYSRWFVASTIIGATTLAQLKENIDAYETSLADDVVDAIDAIHARYTNPGA
jgi:aryl-alcohol dehydrogenase-like predicted oxidoreductase